MPEPPLREDKALTWPHWPMRLRTSSSQEEGVDRAFSVITTRLLGAEGRVTALECTRNGQRFQVPADLVLLAMGFLGPVKEGALADSGVQLTPSGTVAAPDGFRTSNPRILACGDMRRGQSLIVWAIREGRECAAAVDAVLSAAVQRAA
jgi:glutamate synthase (NADPH/NADH) small chain